jgi:6-phosphogluconate dehydrogenase
MGMKKIGVIGLSVMGSNIALNLADHGYSVSAYNRSPDKTARLLEEGKGKDISGAASLEELADSLERPRKILLMVKAGEAVDQAIGQLLPYLSEGDIIIDGGNSYFADTVRRNRELAERGIFFIGTGISGGEEGARHGPAIMPGGDKEAYKQVEEILKNISAKTGEEPCCAYIGPDGAGHFVKMVHNGIEYGDMQLICEAYSILKDFLGMSPPELHQTFKKWNEGELNSYLIDITADIFNKKDEETGKYLVDVILDTAGHKGTGQWTSEAALDLGAPIPTITEAVFLRYLSAMKQERVEASKKLKGPSRGAGDGIKGHPDKEEQFKESVRRALYASKICTYAQGFGLMKNASEKYNWGLEPGNIAMIFRGGCIIRAQFLNRIKEAYDKNPRLPNLLQDDYFIEIMGRYQDDWRKVVSEAALSGIPVPGFASSLSYYDGYRSDKLPVNLLQAQRDYFGAHTYNRTDKEGVFHTNW